jgi:hypothetical protein
VVEAIGKISEVINQINDISNTIASAVEQQSATTNEISRNVAEAARGAGEITRNVNGVSEAAKSTANGASETQNAAGELARMATDLEDLVSRFHYENTSGPFAETAASLSAKKTRHRTVASGGENRQRAGQPYAVGRALGRQIINPSSPEHDIRRAGARSRASLTEDR